MRINQRGEMQMAPQARPIAFTAEQVIDACASRFRWEARFRGGPCSLAGQARADSFREWDGVRVPGRTEAFWQFPEGPFPYFQSEITSTTLK